MKKDKLIEILQGIEGNPDVLFYNGFVDDWQEIEVEEGELARRKVSHYKRMVVLESCLREGKPYPDEEVIKIRMKEVKPLKFPWEITSYADSNTHTFKNVVFICGKVKGASMTDRLGTLNY